MDVEPLVALLVPLLKLFWLLAAGSVLLTLLPVPVPQAFKDAVTLSACRGKLWQVKPSALGPLKDWCVPQAWFLHFYLIGAACNAMVLAAYILTYQPVSTTQAESLMALVLFQIHLIRRALETGFVMKYPIDAKMHGIAYLFGLSYYVAVPLSLVPDAWYLEHMWRHVGIGSSSLQTWSASIAALVSKHMFSHVLGVLLFLVGNVMQFASHQALAQLSRGKQPTRESNVYKIPQGWLFNYVSCPHYMAEILLYLGLVLLTSGRLNSILIFIWVAANLVLAAAATHSWYRAHFKTYPLQRKALIPLVW
eukprot:jgi/Chrzof1/12026/Cz06g18170.t1